MLHANVLHKSWTTVIAERKELSMVLDRHITSAALASPVQSIEGLFLTVTEGLHTLIYAHI